MMASPTTAYKLVALAAQVRRLRPDWRDAEGFYELRSEIAGALMRLSRRLNGQAYTPRAVPPEHATPRPPPARLILPAAGPSRCEAARSPPAAGTTQPAAPAQRVARPQFRQRARPIRHRYPMPPPLPIAVQPRLL
jgi:hypothetical protein